MTAMNNVQAAIHAKLTDDAALRGMVNGIFDAVPSGTAFPYIKLGEATESPFNTFDRKGKDNTFTVHIWSDYEGNKQALEILDRVNVLLDYEPLDVPGMGLVYCRYETATTIEEPNEIRHVPARYRVVTQE